MKRTNKEYENPKLTNAIFKSLGIPPAEFEYHIYIPDHPQPFRLDMAWPKQKVYLEIQGGLYWMKKKRKDGSTYWTKGAHATIKGMKRDWLKNNWLTQNGWRGLYCEPKKWGAPETFEMIKTALKYAP